jgi:hypothetical protein
MNDHSVRNGEDHQHDPLLEGLFSREHTHLPAEPFSSTTLKAVAAERKRALLTRRLTQAAGVLALIALSPVLIRGSVWLSTTLDEVFALASSWLAEPVGMAAAGLVAVAVLAARSVIRR